VIKNRADVIKALEDAGFEIARETKSSISIKNPSGGQNIRLKGAIYERDFRLGEELRAEIERASEDYRRDRDKRIEAARKTLDSGIAKKREYHLQRYRQQHKGHPEHHQQKAIPSGVHAFGRNHHTNPNMRNDLVDARIVEPTNTHSPSHQSERRLDVGKLQQTTRPILQTGVIDNERDRTAVSERIRTARTRRDIAVSRCLSAIRKLSKVVRATIVRWRFRTIIDKVARASIDDGKKLRPENEMPNLRKRESDIGI
jgi:hypothetical protein